MSFSLPFFGELIAHGYVSETRKFSGEIDITMVSPGDYCLLAIYTYIASFYA